MGVRTAASAPASWVVLLIGLAGVPVAQGADKPAPPAPSPQPGAQSAQDEYLATAQTVFPPADRQLLLALANARRLIQAERYAEAVRYLGLILEAPEDYFDSSVRPGKGADRFPSLKSEAQALLGAMPARGRELYELQFGSQARQMLSQAIASGDPAGLAEVSRRFFHTQAGYQAALLLAFWQLDHGSPLAAALSFQRVRQSCPVADQFEPGLSLAMAACWLRAGQNEKAQAALDRLRRETPQAIARIAGADLALSSDLARLIGGAAPAPPESASGQWLMYRAAPDRNASTAAGGPLLSTVWRVPTAEHPVVEQIIDEVRQLFRDEEQRALPALHPLVVKNRVLMRTAKNLLAVDLTTGKRVWEVPGDDPFEALLDLSADGPIPDPFGGMPLDLHAALRYRLWGDATYGTLSSDGQYVFAIEDLSLDLWSWANRLVFGRTGRGGPWEPKPYNRLAAYDIQTGKLVWHLGGSPEELGLPQAGTFFLGPPLPLGKELFVLGELKGEIRLLAVEARTGQVTWTQQLAMVDHERDAVQDPVRRLAGVCPSYMDGVLVCPTSNRSVVALELATRSLVWGYVYNRRDTPEGHLRGPVIAVGSTIVDPDPANRWSPGAVILAEGRVVLAPPDSSEIHCLNLLDGELLWRRPRQDDLLVACVYQGKVVVVGRRGVRALNLADGQPAWGGRVVPLPGASSPSGSGLLTRGEYLLPLTSGEVVAIELDEGRLARSFRSRRGVVPGNLVCAGGLIVSQGPSAVDLFHQVDALRSEIERRLAARPDDPEALAQQGEILWEQGDLKQAIACLRRSLQLAPNPKTRDLLREALFEGLRTDFAAYQADREQLRDLIDDPAQEATFWRLVAAGLEATGQFRAAWQTYLKLIEAGGADRVMEPLDQSHSVRRDRWIRVQLGSLYQAAPAEVRGQIEKEAQARLAAAAAQADPEALRQFLDYFGSLPLAEQARRQWAAKLRQQGRLLEAELALRHLERTGSPTQAGPALAELAFMLHQSGRAEDAALCFARLEREFADRVCRDGKTGRQLLQALPADDPVRKALQPPEPWPTGAEVFQRSAQRATPQPVYATLPIPLGQIASPFFSETTLELQAQQNPPLLGARDAWGDLRWQIPIGEPDQRGYFPVSAGFLRGAVRDHLLVLWTGSHLVAVDTLGVGPAGSPRILWPSPGQLRQSPRTVAVRRGVIQTVPIPLAVNLVSHASAASRQLVANAPVILSEELICHQRAHELCGIDPLTGKELWVRDDTRPGSLLFGDDQFVFVLPLDQRAATVLRASDGKLLGTRAVPRERLLPWGRYVLVWRDWSLELFDPWEGRAVWPPLKFNAGARVSVVGHQWAGVLEPQGRFVLVQVADGQKIIDAKLQPIRTFSDFHVFPSREHYMLVINGLERTGTPRSHFFGLHGVPNVHISRAGVYGFDRQGKQLWAEPVIVEDQYLPIHQPARLPVLVFACGVQARHPNPSPPKTAILCIDKRTGRVLQPNETFDGLSHFRVRGDPDKRTVEFHLYRHVVSLTFTDRPPPPPKTSEAIWRAFWRARGPEAAKDFWEGIQAYFPPLGTGPPPAGAAGQPPARDAANPKPAAPKEAPKR